MLTVSPEPQFGERSPGWLKVAFLDEPEVRSLNAFICDLTSTRELHEALRLISEEVRAFLAARFVAVVVFEGEEQELVGEPGDLAAIRVPLRVAGRNVGEITAYLDQPRALTVSEDRAMQVIAAVAAVTLDNARRLQRERKCLTQSEAVNSLAPRIAVAQTHDELARLLVAALKDRLHYDAARLLWRAGEGDDVVCLAATRSSGHGPTVEQAWQDSGAAVRVLREGTPLLVGDQAEWHKLGGSAPGLRSLLAVPVRGSRGVLGVLEVGGRCPRAFDSADLTTLTSLAAQAAAVAERFGAQAAELGKPAAEPDRGRNEFLSLIVHDLRGPLSLVKGYAATLQRLGDSLDQEKRRRFLAGIDEAADRLNTMVEHLAGVSRLESGKFQLRLRRLDLTPLVTETVERMRLALDEHPISLELPGDLLPVHVDPEHLGRALASLLLYAARQSPASGRITVRITGQTSMVKAWSPSTATAEARPLALEQGYGIVAVRDEGAGIPRQQLTKIFDKVYSLAGHCGRKKGSGLELYVAKKVIEAHGGRVWAESEPGQGSTLSLCLPLSVVDEPAVNS